MSNKEKEALMPKLRFPEFRGTAGWGRHDLGNICEILNNRRRPITGSDREPGPYPYYGASGVVDFVKEFIFDERLLLVGEDGAKWNAFGKTAFIVEGKYWVNNHAHVLKPTEINDSLLENYLTMTDLGGFVTGAAPPKLTLGKLKSIPIPIPPSDLEQQKIADCLSSLDELIVAQARKVDALKAHKKGLMQQLFPREGETQPRLRFPEFQNAEEWQRTSLGGVARLRNGYAFKSAEYVDDGPHQIITIANVQQGGLSIESTRRMAALPPDIQQHQVLSLGDILISMTGNVGRVCRVTVEGLLLNQRVGKLTPEKIDADFFYQLLQRDEFRNTMQLKAAGGAQGNLSSGDITDYVFSAPAETDEQLRIATCLSSLDALVTAATQELEALKIHKKGLMQQLFPSAEDVA